MEKRTDSVPDIATVVLIDRRLPSYAAECDVADRFLAEHGDYESWAPETHELYENTIAMMQTGGAA